MLLSKISTETEKESNYSIILVSCFFYASKFSVLPFLLILLIFLFFSFLFECLVFSLILWFAQSANNQ